MEICKKVIDTNVITVDRFKIGLIEKESREAFL